MRDLIRPELIKPTACAALATAILCLPRLYQGTSRLYPVWYLDSIIFLGGFVLWGFVFAWHTKYTGRPVFTFKINLGDLGFATLASLTLAIALRVFIDPLARQVSPQDYPANWGKWLADCLFTLSLSQLFLVFAPFAWLIRLFQERRVAFALTVLFGLIISILKIRHLPSAVPPAVASALLLARVVVGAASVGVYLRGGVLLTLWLAFLIQLRLLPL